jgi:apolipoprotein N-acyltransferase
MKHTSRPCRRGAAFNTSEKGDKMKRDTPGSIMNKTLNIPSHRLAWLWLLVGFALLPFTFWQNVIPLAAWLAPVFVLRFARTSGRPRLVLPLIFLVYAVSIWISLRGTEQGLPLFEYVAGLLVLPVSKGLLFALPYVADRWASPRLGLWGRTLVFPLAFTSLDWAMSRLVVIMNTGSPAYSQFGNLVLMQILSVTGMWGLTFLITWFAATVNLLWEAGFVWRPVRVQLGVFLAAVLAVFAYGGLRLAAAAPASDTVKAATITLDASVRQAASRGVNWVTFNQSTDAERTAARPGFQTTVDQMLSRTETALRQGATLVGWEEGAGLVLAEDKQGVLDRVSALARRYDAYIQLGLWVSTRTSAHQFVHNQSILVDNSGRVVWTYDKSHPVFPDEWWVMIPGSGQLPIVTTKYGQMSTAVCNDLHFPPLIGQAGQRDVDVFMAPYSSIAAFEQEDFAVAVYRAVENGFSLVRPTGNGLSAVVDYQGRILGQHDFSVEGGGIMMASVPVHGVVTIYSRIGDLFAYLCVAGLVLSVGSALVRRRQLLPAAHAKAPVL